MSKPIPHMSACNYANYWAKVDVRGPDECWPWTAGTTSQGYGRFGISGSLYLAPRIALAISGVDPSGLCAIHKCDNPRCCNPRHIRVGTRAENNADRDTKGRQVSLAGEMHRKSKLKDEYISLIRNDSRTNILIAKDYGVDPSLIGLVKRRKIWKHIK